MKTLKKERFQKLFRKRYALRFHMAAILVTTALSGVIITKLLLALGLESLVLRYALTVVLSYLFFFVCVKLWLFDVSPRKPGGAVDGLWDEGGIAVIIALTVLAAIVATILGSAAYVILEAPVILSEAAFEGVLAASLVKSTRLIDSNEWVGSIFKTTWKPFTITLTVVIIGGLILHAYFPEAHRLADIIGKG